MGVKHACGLIIVPPCFCGSRPREYTIASELHFVQIGARQSPWVSHEIVDFQSLYIASWPRGRRQYVATRHWNRDLHTGESLDARRVIYAGLEMARRPRARERSDIWKSTIRFTLSPRLSAVPGHLRYVVNFQPASYAEGSALMLLATRRIARPHLGDLWLLPCLTLTHVSVILLRSALQLLIALGIGDALMRATVKFVMRRILLVTLRVL